MGRRRPIAALPIEVALELARDRRWTAPESICDRAHRLTGRASQRDFLPFGECQAAALQTPAAPRAHAAGLDQYTAPGAPAGVDDSHRIADETAVGHDLPNRCSTSGRMKIEYSATAAPNQ